MADEQGALDRQLDQLVNINIRNGLQFFNRIDDLTVSNVGLAAREGDEETLKQLLARGKYKSFCASVWESCFYVICEGFFWTGIMKFQQESPIQLLNFFLSDVRE